MKKKMVYINPEEMRGLVKSTGLSRARLAELRGVGQNAVNSWMRPDRSSLPEEDLRFLLSFSQKRKELLKKGVIPSESDILKAMSPEIRSKGLYDPLRVSVDNFSQNNLDCSSIPDGELVDELEKRGWSVTLSRKDRR